jgi:hypothetical protein
MAGQALLECLGLCRKLGQLQLGKLRQEVGNNLAGLNFNIPQALHRAAESFKVHLPDLAGNPLRLESAKVGAIAGGGKHLLAGECHVISATDRQRLATVGKQLANLLFHSGWNDGNKAKRRESRPLAGCHV